MRLRMIGLAAAYGVVLAVFFGAAPAMAAGNYSSFSAIATGSFASGGTASCPDVSCPGSDSCFCVSASVPIKGGVAGTAKVEMLADNTTEVNAPTGGPCEVAGGIIDLSTKAGDTLNIGFDGWFCQSDQTNGSALSLSGTYIISSGTKKYANTRGSGLVSLSGANLNSSGGPSQLQLVGNINLNAEKSPVTGLSASTEVPNNLR
jgi:hypothetical protein